MVLSVIMSHTQSTLQARSPGGWADGGVGGFMPPCLASAAWRRERWLRPQAAFQQQIHCSCAERSLLGTA